MSFLCPNCRQALEPASLVCRNGHRFARVQGVLALLEESFGRQLEGFLVPLSSMRADEGKHILDMAAYERLPFGQQRSGDAAWQAEWRLRQYDLAIVLKLLGRRPRQRILDVGAWNGWLSHRLAARGHAVTAVDYFADEHDGLRARKHYSTVWEAIQMDLRDLSTLNRTFDVVIVNRCLQFFPDPLACAAGAQQRVGPGGLLIVTGLQIFRVAGEKARSVEAERQAYRNRYAAEMFLFPTRGYLDSTDEQRLRELGVAFYGYLQLWPASIKAAFRKTRPRHYYGMWSP